MGKPDKKSSNSAEVLSTAYSSDTAPVSLDRSPPLAFSTGADYSAGFHQEIFNLLHTIQDQLGTIESRLSTLERSTLPESTSHISYVQDLDLPFTSQSSTVTTDFSKPSADQVLSTSETQPAITNVKNRLADSLTLTHSDSYADSLFRSSFLPLFNSLLCPSSNFLDVSLDDLYIYNVLCMSSLQDKTIFPQLYRPQYSYIPINISTIPFLFFSISTLATSTLYFWVTPPLRPPDPAFTKQGLLTFGN
jgi:hypothetical protein